VEGVGQAPRQTALGSWALMLVGLKNVIVNRKITRLNINMKYLCFIMLVNFKYVNIEFYKLTAVTSFRPNTRLLILVFNERPLRSRGITDSFLSSQ